MLSGSHYDRSWIVHNSISEALERILLSSFLRKAETVPLLLSLLSADPEMLSSGLINESISFAESYERFHDEARNGVLRQNSTILGHVADKLLGSILTILLCFE